MNRSTVMVALGAIAVCVVVVFAAYTAGTFSQDAGQAQAEDRPSYQGDRDPANGGLAGADDDVAEAEGLRESAQISRDRAEESALGEVSGDVVGAGLDDENGSAAYQIDVLANDGSLHEVGIDATNGDVLYHTTEDQDDASEARGLFERASVPREDAERAALGRFPGQVQEIGLDDESGKTVYNVEILGDDGNLHEAAVDAESGDVIASETEDRNGTEDEGAFED